MANTVENIRGRLNKGTMTYSVYDANHMLIELYEAQWDAHHGEPCLKTEFKYVTDTTRLMASRETVVGWDSAWDFDSL